MEGVVGAALAGVGQIRAPTSVAVDGEIWAPVLDRAALDDDGGVFQDCAAVAVDQRAAGNDLGVRCGHKANQPVFQRIFILT